MKAKKYGRVMIVSILCLFLMTPVFSCAETGGVAIAAKTSIHVGDTLNVTVNYSAASLGYINGRLSYDPDLLQYVSGGTGDTAAGIVQMIKGLTGQPTRSFTIRFKALAAGTDYLQVQTIDLVDLDERDLGNPGASIKYVIKKVPEKDPTVDSVDNNDDSANISDNTTSGNSVDPADNSGTVKQPTTEKAPDTIWIYVGAIAVTVLLLILAVVVSRRKRK